MPLRIGLHLIVKNEEDRIASCIESNIGLADYFSIAVDSGSSSDKTYEVCRSLVGSENVFRHEWLDDFSDARNKALKHLLQKHPDTDYVYWIDSDDVWSESSISFDEIRRRLEEQSPLSVRNQYIYGFDFSSSPPKPNLTYQRTRMWKTTKSHGIDPAHTTPKSCRKWIGPAHEVNVEDLSAEGPDVVWDDWILTHLKGSNENHRIGRTTRNIKALKKGLRDEPKNARYTFYLAREYKDLGDYTNSIETYKEYLPLSQFKEEKYQALLDLSNISKNLGDIDQAEYYAKEAWTLKPDIAEAVVLLGEIYSLKGNWGLARPCFAYAIHAPHGYVLFDNVSSRTHAPHRWLSVACYYTGDKQQAAYHHQLARSLAPLDFVVRGNEVWMFHNDYYPEHLREYQEITVQTENETNKDSLNYPIEYASKLSDITKTDTDKSLVEYSDKICIKSILDQSLSVHEIEIVDEPVTNLVVTDYVQDKLDVKLVLLDNLLDNYSKEIINKLISFIELGGYLIIDNFGANSVKSLVSDILRANINLSIIRVIDYQPDKKLAVIVKV